MAFRVWLICSYSQKNTFVVKNQDIAIIGFKFLDFYLKGWFYVFIAIPTVGN